MRRSLSPHGHDWERGSWTGSFQMDPDGSRRWVWDAVCPTPAIPPISATPARCRPPAPPHDGCHLWTVSPSNKQWFGVTHLTRCFGTELNKPVSLLLTEIIPTFGATCLAPEPGGGGRQLVVSVPVWFVRQEPGGRQSPARTGVCRLLINLTAGNSFGNSSHTDGVCEFRREIADENEVKRGVEEIFIYL
jgi:hypothetical protein